MAVNSAEGFPATVVGRYALFEEIAAGGMAAVHYGRLLGPVGFSRTVAIKRLHPHLARDPEFAAMFLDEARVAARVRHPNVVPTLDIVSTQGELFLVMEYVQGESLARLMRAAKRRKTKMPPPVAAAIIVGTLHGLHAAHEAKNERGQPLGIVHRDVSPQNILVGLDGIPRLVDFGVAKATGRVQTTREGQLKGKIAYMAPEQIRGAMPTRLVDIYASGILFWEMLTGERLFGGENDVIVLERALHLEAKPPSSLVPNLPKELDAIVLKGLSRDPAQRFQTAREMAREIENATPIASISKVGEWVESIAGEVIAERAAKVAEIESRSQIRPGAISVPSGPPGAASGPPPPLGDVTETAAAPPVPASPSSAPRAAESPPPAPGDELSSDATLASPEVPVGGGSASEPPQPLPMGGADRKKLLIFGGVGAAVVLLIVGIAIAAGGSKSSSAAAASSSPAVTSPPPTTPATATTEAPAATTTAAATTAVATTKPPATTPPAPPPAHTPLATAVATVAPTVTARPTATSASHATPGKPNCNPPYTIDSNGVKQYKVECL